MWMNLQARQDLEAAEERLAKRIEMEVQPMRRTSWVKTSGRDARETY
jgi:plasmid maintenance system antidote protein VapI